METYLEIVRHDISVSLDFDRAKKDYLAKFAKDNQELTTHIEKKYADECMDGIKCVYIGMQGQFIKNFAERE